MQEIKGFTEYKLGLRDRILDAAINAFALRGVKATKMDDIAASLTISKRTLYELYDTKEQLIFEAIKRHHQLNEERLSAFAKDPAHDVLDIVIFIYRMHIQESGSLKPTFYDEIAKYPQIVEYLDADRARKAAEFQNFMHRGIDEGFFRAEIDYEIVAHLFEAIGTYMRHHRLYQQYTFEDLFFNMLFVSLRGLCTPKGIEKLDKFFAETK